MRKSRDRRGSGTVLSMGLRHQQRAERRNERRTEMTTSTENMCTEEYVQSPESELEELVAEQPAPPGGFQPDEAQSALMMLWHDLLAIPVSEVRPFKVSATDAVGLGLAYASAYAEDRPRFAGTFDPDAFDPADYDDMADRAMAFWQADIHMRRELNSDGPFRTKVLEAKPLRIKLMKAATYLWGEDPELGDVVAAIRKGQGYRDKADDLGSLAALFTEQWADAEGRCDVTVEDLARAEELGAGILEAMSPGQAQVIGDARVMRLRAAEHLRRGLEDLRDAARYVFRKDRAMMERYPSLFVRRKKKGSSSAAGAETNPESPAESQAPEPAETEPTADHLDQLYEEAEAIAQDG
jgi:hypothetical protein